MRRQLAAHHLRLRTFTRSLLAISFVMACLILSSCTFNFFDSGGGRTGQRPATNVPPDHNTIVITYDNWIGFTHDLTATIDNIFARVHTGDHDAEQLAKDFIQPGLDMLATNYGILLPPSTLVAKPERRQLQFQADWSPWATFAPMRQSLLASLPLEPLSSGSIRWRARLLNSHAQFNPLTPRRITIHAELELALQRSDTVDAQWTYPYLNQGAINGLKASFLQDILETYYIFLRDNYNVDVDSPAFRGFHEN